MSHRVLLLLSFLFFVTNFISAKDKYVDCHIMFLDGKEKKCLIKLPMGASSERIVIKEDLSASKKTLKTDLIHYIIISNNGVDVIYERTKIYEWKLNKSKKLSKYGAFVKIIGNCENIRSYLSYAELDIDKRGNLIEMFLDGMGGQLLKRKHEDYPCPVGYTFLDSPITQKGFDKQRKKMLEVYFSDDKEILKYLKGTSAISEQDFEKLFNSICK